MYFCKYLYVAGTMGGVLIKGDVLISGVPLYAFLLENSYTEYHTLAKNKPSFSAADMRFLIKLICTVLRYM